MVLLGKTSRWVIGGIPVPSHDSHPKETSRTGRDPSPPLNPEIIPSIGTENNDLAPGFTAGLEER